MRKDILTTDSFAGQQNRHILTHWHNSIELIHITEGSLHCLIRGTEYTVGKNSICIINQKQLHRIYCDEDKDCSFRSIMIDPELFTADQEIYGKYIEPVLNDDHFSQIISDAGTTFSSEIINLMDAISDLQRIRPTAYELSVIAYLHMIFRRFYIQYEAAQGSLPASVPTDTILYRKMADFIYRNYTQKISLDDITSAASVSRSKCCQLFKKYAQHSPIDFLNNYRLQVSADLLQHSGDSISDIALNCGFGQPSYYNRLFLREYGITPKEYRKNSSNEKVPR